MSLISSDLLAVVYGQRIIICNCSHQRHIYTPWLCFEMWQFILLSSSQIWPRTKKVVSWSRTLPVLHDHDSIMSASEQPCFESAIFSLYLHYPRRLWQSAWVVYSSLSFCLYVCPQHNSKMNDSKVFKFDIGNVLWISTSVMIFRLKGWG